jgi:voltage-gated potassium channel Kch
VIEENENPVIIAGFGRFGVLIGRFLKANGIGATILDNNPGNIQVLRKFGFKVYYGDATRPDLLRIAGAAHARVLVVAIDGKEDISSIVQHVRHTYPNLKVIARAVDVPHSFALEDLEVDAQRRETYDASLELGVRTLISLGHEKYLSHRMARSFRYHDSMIMRELHKLWGKDDKHYFNEVRRFSEQLETILSAEQDQTLHEHDGAWDSTSLREEVQTMYEEMQRKGRK